jgi:hypothetical protein
MKVKTFIPILFSVSIVIVAQLSAYGKSKEVPYLRDGVSFSIAEGWKVIANDSIADGAYYFSAERTGTKTTGLITVTWANKEEDPDKAILAHQKSMKNSNIYRNPGIEFTMIVSDKLGGHDVRRCEYTTIAKGIKLEGIVYCFSCSGKTIVVFFQTGIDDHNKNQKGFGLFQKTFNCRE